VKKKEPRPKKLFHVSCPTCAATAAGRCELHSGAPRSELHSERTLAAIEAAERTRIHVVRDVDDSAWANVDGVCARFRTDSVYPGNFIVRRKA
jgi:hypothetical protein